MDLLEFEDIKEIFLQFKSLHKNIQELTSQKSNREGLSADQCYLLGLIDHFDHPNPKNTCRTFKHHTGYFISKITTFRKSRFYGKSCK